MIDERLRNGAEALGVSLTQEMLEQFACYQRILANWNQTRNLTAICDPDEVRAKHFLDSLTLLSAYKLPHGARIIDVGTGAGFPGVPLKIARPDLHLTLLDSLLKRIEFLQALSQQLGQENCVLHARAEELAQDAAHREGYDIVTARALAALPLLTELCLGYLRVGGAFLVMKGPDVEEELGEAQGAIGRLGGKHTHTASYDIPGAGMRTILVIEKITQTPTPYPRTFKKMTKTPL